MSSGHSRKYGGTTISRICIDVTPKDAMIMVNDKGLRAMCCVKREQKVEVEAFAADYQDYGEEILEAEHDPHNHP